MAATPKPKRNTPTKRRSFTTTKRRPPSTTTATTITQQREATIASLIPTVQTALSDTRTFLLNHDLHLLPSHILSLESSFSKIQSLLAFHPQSTPKIQSLPQQSCWFERFVLSTTYTDEDPRWVQIFRMSKPTFSLLNSALSLSLSSALPSPIPPHFALGSALYRLAHDGSFSFVGRRFGFSSADACRAFYTVCKVICEELGGCVSNFGSEMGGILMGFEEIKLRNCCGALGFERFGVEGELLGKDGSLIVQGLVDCDGRFTDVSVGWPSTFKPESILRQTRLFVGVEKSKELLNGPEVELLDGNLVGQYVLGDSCYPCLPWLVTPFVKKGEGEGWSSSEIEFNEVHRRVMWLVRMAFGRIRANWQLLNRRWREDFVEFLPFIITTACVLNNFLMKHGEMLPDVDMQSGEDVEMPVYEGKVSESSAKVRNLLALHLSRASQR